MLILEHITKLYLLNSRIGGEVMSRIRFWQGSRPSGGSRRLREELRSRGHSALKLRGNNTSFVAREGDCIITWGSTKTLPLSVRGERALFINNPTSLSLCSNKRKFFEIAGEAGIPTPLYTSSAEEAISLAEEEGASHIYCRATLTGHSGAGITVLSSDTEVDEVPECPLYTVGIPIKRELRLHVFQNSILLIQQKKKLSSASREERGGLEVNALVRNTAGGYIFAVQGVRVPEDVQEDALKLYTALGQDFLALDVVESVEGYYYFLEANTAPGISGSTVGLYADAIEEAIRRVGREEEGGEEEEGGGEEEEWWEEGGEGEEWGGEM